MAGPDLSEFEALCPRSVKRPCQLGPAIAALSEQEADQLAAACATSKEAIPATAIEKWLAARGHKASVQAIAYHRKGQCACHG